VTRIKICGLTQPEDALRAAELGADLLGLIIAESPRRVAVAEAAAWTREIRGSFSRVRLVGVFVRPAPGEAEKAAAALGLDLVQVHGLAPEEPFSCALPVIRACAPAEVPSAVRHEPWGVLVDTPAPGGVGGTGRVFAWSALPRERPARLLLAGGLAPDNVGAAIARVRPWGVDASSRLEAAPGIKDAARIAAFIAAVRAADAAAGGVAPEGEVAS